MRRRRFPGQLPGAAGVQTVSHRWIRGCRRFLGLALLCCSAAQAEVIEIAWSEQGRFERRLSVAPGKFAEVCGKLTRAQVVAWRYDASGPLNFNIHYHVGKDVHYPERLDARAAATGRLQAGLDQDFCWMWTNKEGQAVTLDFHLQR